MPWPKIVYEDIAPGAAGDTTLAVSEKQSWNTPADALVEHETVKVGTLEHNFWLLDSSFKFFPDNAASQPFGWWTESMSDINGFFETQPVLTLTLGGMYTSVGLTFTFDSVGPTWPTWMNVKWYRGNELLADEDFAPDRYDYSAIKTVKRFDKLVITFDRMCKGYRYLKMERAIYGIVRIFGKDEYSNISMHDSVSLISDELEAGDAVFSVRNLSLIPFNFLRKQTLYFYHGEDLLGVRFILKAQQLTENRYKVTAQGFLGLLSEGEDHMGGMYLGSGILSEVLIAEIIGDVVPYTLDDALKGIVIKGWLPIDSRLDNLARVLFVIGGCVSGARSKSMRIFKPVLPGSGDPISLAGRSRVNPTLNSDKAMTAVQVTEHSFSVGTEVIELYNGTLSGSTKVNFAEPVSGLAITGGTINTQGANYATITGTGGTVTLTGIRYKHTTRVLTRTNDLVESNTFPNVPKCKENYLVTPSNSAEVLDRYFNYWLRNTYVNTSFRLRDDDVGDLVQLENSFHGDKLGNLVDLDLNVSKLVLADAKVVLAAETE